MDDIESIILRHSRRGMIELSAHMPGDFCARAARKISAWPRGNVIIVTGFYVAGHAETDGPPGALALARALEELGCAPVIVTDTLCRGLFEGEGMRVEYVDLSASDDELSALLERLRPAGMISIERCGRTAQGHYLNTRGVDIGAHTAPLDRLFELAGGVPTVGIGDGGNEIGMGVLAGPIATQLAIQPCAVPTGSLVIATVSNWGAYGLCAELELLSGRRCLPSPDDAVRQIERIVALGCVDGISHMQAMSVDGFDMDIEREILIALARAVRAGETKGGPCNDRTEQDGYRKAQ